MPAPITVSHSAHGAANAPMALGIAANIFADAGLDVRMLECVSAGDAVRRLTGGEAQFAVAGGMPILRAVQAGHDLVIVMSLEAENVFAIVGARGIDTPDKLRGAKVAVTGTREQDAVLIRRALKDWSIDEADVTFIVREGRGGCWDAVVEGEAAAMAATIPQPILARALGLPVLRDFADLQESYQAGALVTTRDYAEVNPQAVMDFLRAQLRSVRLFQGDFALAHRHLAERSKLTDERVLRETHRLFGAAMEHYVPDRQALANVLETLEDAIGRKTGLRIDRIVEPRFALALEANGPI